MSKYRMRAHEIMRLDELVNAPDLEVYHWTSAPAMNHIIRNNLIKANTEHELNGKTYTGVSLTRNPLFDIQHTYVIGGAKAWRIGLNLRKLKADHKVFPIRYKPYRDIPRSKTIKSGSFLGNDLIGFHDTSSDESEEFCVGDIFPIWNYISSIAVEMRNVSIDTHPSETSIWEPEDFTDGDGSFGSAYSQADQDLLFDIMVGTFYGQEPYKNIWARYGAKTRKSAIRLPDNIPFNVIDRETNRAYPFKQVAKAELERYNLAPPEEPKNKNIDPIDADLDTRNERNRRFDQTSKAMRY